MGKDQQQQEQRNDEIYHATKMMCMSIKVTVLNKSQAQNWVEGKRREREKRNEARRRISLTAAQFRETGMFSERDKSGEIMIDINYGVLCPASVT